MGLFKKKPGGTFFGNLLRGGAQIIQKVAGVNLGIGSGANMIPLPDTSTSPVAPVSSSPVAPITSSPVAPGLSGLIDDIKGVIHGANDTLNNGLKVDSSGTNKTVMLAVGGLLVVVLVFFGLKKKK